MQSGERHLQLVGYIFFTKFIAIKECVCSKTVCIWLLKKFKKNAFFQFLVSINETVIKQSYLLHSKYKKRQDNVKVVIIFVK